MTTWTRTVLWMVWLAAVGWLWFGGSLGTGAALAAALLSLLMFALPGVRTCDEYNASLRSYPGPV